MKTATIKEDMKKYKQQVNLEPNNPEAHYYLGINYGANDDSKAAITELKEAIRLKKDFTEAYAGLGLVYGSIGDTPKALMEYTKAIQNNPTAETYYYIALSFRRIGIFRVAIVLLEKSLRLKDDVDSHLLLAHTFADVKQFKNAAKSFKKVLELTPNDSRIRADYAHCLFLSGKKALALCEVMKLKKKDKVKVDLIYNMITGRAISKFRGR